jgi:DNA modification methylase
MEIQTVGIDEVIPYAKNPRKNDAAVDKVAGSLKEFGWRQPIVVDAEMVVIAGHTRLAAARKLQLKEVPIHIATDLTANQIKAYRIADNRVSQEAKWDDDLLALELADLDLENYDLSKTGFNDDELAALMAEAITEGLVDEDQVPPEPETPVTVLGDIWQLGRHRVMCGDSTSIDAVDTLMETRPADMVFTDPPYGMSYGGGRAAGSTPKGAIVKAHGMILGDEFQGDDLINLVRQAISAAYASSKSGAAYYICFTWRTYSEFEAAIVDAGLKIANCIVWDKKSIGLGQSNYRPQHEFIFYVKGDGWQGDKSQSDIWKMSRGATGEYVHPTQKPVELIEKALANSSKSGDTILDVFGGSGSTLIACEKTNRQARLMELDPKYVDVIVKRWQDFTGLIAINEKTGKTFNEMNNGTDHVSA